MGHANGRLSAAVWSTVISAVGATMCAIVLFSGNVFALQWQDNSISYTTSNQFTEPGVTQKVTKHIVEYVHANGYRLGNNLFRAKLLRSDENDPVDGGTKGATEVYVVYRHLLSLGALLDRPVAFGLIKDVGLTVGFDLNTKNSAFGPRKRLLVAGPTLTFDVPPRSMLNLSLLAAQERNECNLPPCLAPGAKQRITFDTFPLIHAAWQFPITVGRTNTRLEGFAAKGFRRGTDYVGNNVAHETLVRVAWLADVGSLVAGRPNSLFAGVGYELWRNKYGSDGLPGGDTDAPTLQLKWHF